MYIKTTCFYLGLTKTDIFSLNKSVFFFIGRSVPQGPMKRPLPFSMPPPHFIVIQNHWNWMIGWSGFDVIVLCCFSLFGLPKVQKIGHWIEFSSHHDDMFINC